MTSAADDDNVKLLPEEWERLEVSFSWRGIQKTASVDMVCHIAFIEPVAHCPSVAAPIQVH